MYHGRVWYLLILTRSVNTINLAGQNNGCDANNEPLGSANREKAETEATRVRQKKGVSFPRLINAR